MLWRTKPRYPQSGGTYVYLREAFGSGLAFLYGWMCLLVLDPGLAAALATGLTAYAAYILHWSPSTSKFAAVGILGALCLLNSLSTAVSAGFMRWITWLKCGVLAFLVIFAIVFRLGSWSHYVPFWTARPGSLPLAPALASAMVAGFFSFGGWWDVSKIAGEIRDPQRTLPRALIFGVIVVTVLYISISAVFLYLVPLQSVTSDETFVAQAGAVLFGNAGGNILAAIVIVCVLGSLAVFTMAAPRVYYAMANDGLFLHAVARPHPRFGTPANAILLQGAIACLLVTIGNFQQIIAYFIFVAVLFLGLAVAGLFLLRRRDSFRFLRDSDPGLSSHSDCLPCACGAPARTACLAQSDASGLRLRRCAHRAAGIFSLCENRIAIRAPDHSPPLLRPCYAVHYAFGESYRTLCLSYAIQDVHHATRDCAGTKSLFS